MLILGLMSGTSVDGIDAALVDFDSMTNADGNERLEWRLRHFTCVAWQPAMRQAILDACRAAAPLQTVTTLNYAVGEAFANAARQAVGEANLSLKDVDCIASHGQTIWHQPIPFAVGGVMARGTLQIGEPSVIAARTGCRVVADFRHGDMALGGQGAPLVPYADFMLLRSDTEARIVQNIGGIANLTFLPPRGKLADVIAFDTGPGNMLLDALVSRITEGRLQYDINGSLAAQGTICEPLLGEFIADSYFAQMPPKSTGREQFGQAYADRFYLAAQSQGCNDADCLATATLLTARSIAQAYQHCLPPHDAAGTVVIVGGGGASNPTLMRMLAQEAKPARVTTHAEYGLPDDAKEAVAFALLAFETLRGRPSNVPSATGASGRAILGKIVPPPPL